MDTAYRVLTEAREALKDSESGSIWASHIQALSEQLEESLEREKQLQEKLAAPSSAQEALIRYGDPNALGELLREAGFIGEGLGCYYNFDVRADAKEWDSAERQNFYTQIGWIDPTDPDEWNDWEEVVNKSHGYSFSFENVKVEMAWYWDGDGVLAYRVWRDKELLRSIINSDCKKPYRWEEVEALNRDRPVSSTL
jgi:hypothetical protein